MARKTKKLELDVDERTGEMSDAALFCRKNGHAPDERGMTRRRYQELIADGLWEDILYCRNGCGYTRTITWRLNGGAIVNIKTEYSDKSYLLPKNHGGGRLNRDSARVASVARRIPKFA
jgi:hypothetical protein